MKIVIFVTAFLTLGGCISFNEKMLPNVNISPALNQSIIIEVKLDKFDDISRLEAVKLANDFMTRWKSKKIIGGYGFYGELQEKSDYTLALSGAIELDGPLPGGIFWPMLSQVTFGAFPSTWKETYFINFDLLNRHNNKKYQVNAKNACTWWFHALLFAFVPFYHGGCGGMEDDIADYAYNELYKQGAFSMSHLRREISH